MWHIVVLVVALALAVSLMQRIYRRGWIAGYEEHQRLVQENHDMLIEVHAEAAWEQRWGKK